MLVEMGQVVGETGSADHKFFVSLTSLVAHGKLPREALLVF